MLCPIKVNVQIKSCDMEKCAWWLSAEQMCAILGFVTKMIKEEEGGEDE